MFEKTSSFLQFVLEGPGWVVLCTLIVIEMSTLKIAVITFDIKTEGLGKVKINKKVFFLSIFILKKIKKQKEVIFYSCSRGFFSLFLDQKISNNESFFASAERWERKPLGAWDYPEILSPKQMAQWHNGTLNQIKVFMVLDSHIIFVFHFEVLRLVFS